MLHVDASETESRANLQDILLDHCQHFILALPLHEHIMLRLICKRFLTHVDSLRYLYYPQHKNDIQQRLASYHVQSLKCDLDDLQNAEYLGFYIQYLINSWIITAPPYNYCQDCLMVDPSETTSAFGVYKIKLHLMHFFEIVTTRIHQALVWWTAEQEETTTIEERIWDAIVQDVERPFGAGLLGRVSNQKWDNIQWVVENPTGFHNDERCGYLDFIQGGVDMAWLKEHFRESVQLGTNPTIAHLMNGVFKCKTGKRDNWFEMFTGVKINVDRNEGVLTISLNFDLS